MSRKASQLRATRSKRDIQNDSELVICATTPFMNYSIEVSRKCSGVTVVGE